MARSYLRYEAHTPCFSVEFLLLKLAKLEHVCTEVTEMVSAMSVPMVSSFWCPLFLLEVLFISWQHR